LVVFVFVAVFGVCIVLLNCCFIGLLIVVCLCCFFVCLLDCIRLLVCFVWVGECVVYICRLVWFEFFGDLLGWVVFVCV